MTLYVDSSALVKRYVEEPGREQVLAAMADEEVWCTSELTRTEVLLVLHRIAGTARQADRLARRLHADWDAFHVVPVDDRCLAAAAEVGANFGLRVVDAIHLAAAARLPRPVRYLTLDPRQVSAVVSLELELVTSEQ